MAETSSGQQVPDAQRGNLVDRFAPDWLKPFLRLARIDRPIGWWLLLLPCWWSAGLASIAGHKALPDIGHLMLFLVGAIAMRGAGSTYNDIVDRELDRKVERTRSRPVASGAVSVRAALVFALLQGLVGLAVLLSLNSFSVLLGLVSLVPVAIYPFMKRITSWPQAVLGLAFSWGALMGWSATFGSLSAPALLLYAGAVAWTMGYDTIYAIQDLEDDAVAGIRSTALLFGQRTQIAVSGFYAVTAVCIALALYSAGTGPLAYLGLILFGGHLAWQCLRIDIGNGQSALALFRSNRNAGLILFAGLIADGVGRNLIAG